MGYKKQSQFTGGQAKAHSGSQPIGQHPLFPAIVALWFGAAFGLASLAIQPSVIENAVVASGIDKIIPMAAPPLGTTTRILISLAMTALGGVIGSLAARRLSRPAAASQPRRRSPAAEPPADNHAEAAAPVAPRTFGGSRRRALALHDDQGDRPVSDHAPLPGHQARILNLAEFDLDGFEDAAAQASDVVVDAPAPVPEAFEAPAFTPPAFTPPAFVPPAPAGPEMAAHSVGRDREEEGAADAQPPRETAPALKVLENRLFQTYAREIKARADDGARARSAPLFGAPAPVVAPGFDLLPRIGLGEWGEESDDSGSGVDQAAEPQPLFAPPAAIEESITDAVDETPAIDTAPVHEEVVHEEAVAEEPDAVCATVSDDAGTGEPEASEDRPSAADRIAHAELDALSHVELLERLALAMEQQRRLAAAARTASLEAAPFEADLPEATAEPLPAEEQAIDTASEPAAQGPAPFARPQLPPAMRPVAFDEPEEDDALPGYVPPRHILRAPDTPAEEPTAAAEQELAEEPAESTGQEEDVLEAGYSSLLDLSRPATEKPRFVRIEEPESVAIEPVVIFPGEAPKSPPPFSAPSPATAETSASIAEGQRAFDRPGSGLAANTPADTEKALRAALATLQRMSGAA